MDFDKIFLEHAALVGSTDKQQGKKVYNFLKRNKDRNAHLYLLPEDRVNIDFIVCPVLGTRTLNIKKMYIENVLLMTVESFKETYPDQLLSCKGLTKAIGAGLQEIDEETGLTKHQLSALKSKETRSEVGEDGLTSYERSGIKTKETHMSRIDENGLNGYQRIAKDARPKQIETLGRDGIITGTYPEKLFRAYRDFIQWLDRNIKADIDNSSITDKSEKLELDHIFPVSVGLKDKLSPFVIAHPCNLQILTKKDNISKFTNVTLPHDELFEKTGYSKELSDSEFKLFKTIVDKMIERNEVITSADILIKFNNSNKERKFAYETSEFKNK